MRLREFRVENYRTVRSTDWIRLGQMTSFVGQNEAGKSNLCEALYVLNPSVPAKYILDEDWPVDDWGNKDAKALVCEARFALESIDEQKFLLDAAGLLWKPTPPKGDETEDPAAQRKPEGLYSEDELPLPLLLRVSKNYSSERTFTLEADSENHASLGTLDATKIDKWIGKNLPKCVYIREYEFEGSQVELNQFHERTKGHSWSSLSQADQMMSVVLDLAKVNIEEFIRRGDTPEGRTVRSFDKRQASAYLTGQFAKLWGQKQVRFDIDVDGTTLNIFVEDVGIGMPVRLSKRSTGFRWYVSFAWKFTHATRGDYKNSILILEEPGVHLHHGGHPDLLKVLEQISTTNTVIYTTHLSTMLDQEFPERIRIVEIEDHHTRIISGVISKQRVPMMLIESRLGLTPNASGLLGARQTLVVEGGDDVLILEKLSGLLRKSGRTALSERIYLWPAQGAPKTPMYAAFLVGHDLDGGVLLDSDAEGEAAKKKITDLYLTELADRSKFRVLMLKDASGVKKNEAAIEDLLDEGFYLDCVNTAYGIQIRSEDLPLDGSDQITKRVESVLKTRYGRSALDKRLVMTEMLGRFDRWRSVDDLPKQVAENAERLISRINDAFTSQPPATRTGG